ncbi:hypothetical protein VQ042_10585 [Aurantimonas sp. A2-1-M11]|uniref:hypothetical protein n=1 Tax=Aurantimonas sp. A2-1-M11 TaxID=3113712 RepID=UPI002F9310CB
MCVDFYRLWPVYVSLLIALLSLLIPFATPEMASWAMGEIGLIERSTALFYVGTAVLASVAFARSAGMMRLHAGFWILLSIVCFGEETSWLQHEFGFATPSSIEARNVQGEFNFHNLEGFHGGKFLGEEVSSPALGALLSAQNLFQIGFGFFFLILPFAAQVPIFGSLLTYLRMPFPGRLIVSTVWPPITVTLLLAFFTEGQIKDLAAETRELFYAAAFLLFTGTLALTLRDPVAIERTMNAN